MRLSELYEQDPKAALEHVLAGAETQGYSRRAFLWVSQYGLDGVRYGRFRYIGREELIGRTYAVEFWDCAVSILFLDVLHDPKTHKNIPLDDL